MGIELDDELLPERRSLIGLRFADASEFARARAFLDQDATFHFVDEQRRQHRFAEIVDRQLAHHAGLVSAAVGRALVDPAVRRQRQPAARAGDVRGAGREVVGANLVAKAVVTAAAADDEPPLARRAKRAVRQRVAQAELTDAVPPAAQPVARRSLLT